MIKQTWLLAALFLCSCGNNAQNNTSEQKSTTTEQQTVQKTSTDNATNNTPPPAQTGSLAGLYVQSYAGANSQSYELKFENGKYVGTYMQFEGKEETTIPLSEIVADEANKTLSFKQQNATLNAKLTNEGLLVGDDDMPYEKR